MGPNTPSIHPWKVSLVEHAVCFPTRRPVLFNRRRGPFPSAESAVCGEGRQLLTKHGDSGEQETMAAAAKYPRKDSCGARAAAPSRTSSKEKKFPPNDELIVEKLLLSSCQQTERGSGPCAHSSGSGQKR